MKKWLIPLVVVAVLVGAYFGAAAVFSARLDRARAALAAAGHPAAIEDLAPLFARGSEEAARLYDSAGAWLEEGALVRMAYYDSIGWRDDPAGLDSLLRARAVPLNRLLLAAGLGPARFGQEYRQGIHARLVAPVKQFGVFHILLHLHARSLLNRGRADSALAVLGRAFALTEACAEPLLIYWLVGVIDQDTCLGLVARCAHRASVAALDRAIDELSRPDPSGPLVRALETEVVMMQDALRQGSYQGGLDEEGRPVDFSWMTLLPLRRWVQWRQLEHGRGQLELIGRPWHEAYAALARLDSSVTGPGVIGRLLRMTSPSCAAFQTRCARLLALRDAAVAGLRYELARRKPGTGEPGPLPEDPFTGGPLRLRAGKDGFAVYSTGPDRNDDGGDPEKDIVFRVSY